MRGRTESSGIGIPVEDRRRGEKGKGREVKERRAETTGQHNEHEGAQRSTGSRPQMAGWHALAHATKPHSKSRSPAVPPSQPEISGGFSEEVENRNGQPQPRQLSLSCPDDGFPQG